MKTMGNLEIEWDASVALGLYALFFALLGTYWEYVAMVFDFLSPAWWLFIDFGNWILSIIRTVVDIGTSVYDWLKTVSHDVVYGVLNFFFK
jgi:hypothetical protein